MEEVYRFDGEGNLYSGSWDIANLGELEFLWLHIQLPNPILNPNQLYTAHLPFLNIRDILYLTNHGSLCATLNDILFFRVNSSDSPYSNFAFRFAARLSQNSLITIASGEFSRLGFLPKGKSPIFIDGDDSVPKCVSNLLVRVLHQHHVLHLRQLLFDLQMQLTGEGALNKPMLDKIQVNVERAHQVTSRVMRDDRSCNGEWQVMELSESVLTRVKEECSRKEWFRSGDITAIEDLIGQLGMLKGDVGMIARRATAIQLRLDSWSSARSYFISIMALVVSILSLILTVMNVRGVLWTDQSNSKGFQNVMLLCLSSAFCVLLLFSYTLRPRGTLLEKYEGGSKGYKGD